MNREIKTDLHTILDLISCSTDYGFENDILFNSFGKMLNNNLPENEIILYARKVESEDGYGEEDYEEIKTRLEKFKNKYCTED